MESGRLTILLTVAAVLLNLTVLADPVVPSKSDNCYETTAVDVLVMVDDQSDSQRPINLPDVGAKDLIAPVVLPSCVKVSERLPDSRFSLALLGDGSSQTQPFFTLVSPLQSYVDFEKAARAVANNSRNPMRNRYTVSPFYMGLSMPEVGWKNETVVDRVLRTKVLVRVTKAAAIEIEVDEDAKFLCQSDKKDISCPDVKMFANATAFPKQKDGVVAIVIADAVDLWSKVIAQSFDQWKVLTPADAPNLMGTFLAQPESFFSTNVCPRAPILNSNTSAPNATATPTVSYATNASVKSLAATSLLVAAVVY